MALKDLLVCLDTHPSVDSRIKLGLALAQRHDARVAGLYVVPPAPMPAYYTPEAIEISRSLRKKAAESFKRSIGRRFNEALRREGIAGELRVVEGELGDAAATHARYADLTIVGQLDPDKPEESMATPDDVVLDAGRPVLMVPYIGYTALPGERVIVAWNAGREAARAVSDAMPFLERAKLVRVLAINPERTGPHGEDPGADIAVHLARHGVKTDVATINTDIDPADMLLSQVSDFGADLIVMGAYGHSRAREVILGGMTRHILRHMTVPVLMSH